MGNKLGSSCAGHAAFGNNMRDDMIQYQIDNELGYKLQMSTSGNAVTFTMLSKSGANLGYGTFNLGGDTALTDVKLDAANQKLRFIFANGAEISCSISDIYDKIAAKQDKLVSGENIRTVNGKSLVGSGGVVIGIEDILTAEQIAAANSGITSAKVSKLDGIAEGATKVEKSDVNGDIKVNGEEVVVYKEPLDVVRDSDYRHISVSATDGVSDGESTYKYDDSALAGRVSAIESDYLKSSDKTAIESDIDSKVGDEKTRAEGAESALSAAVGEKVDKEEGKGLSSNDFSDAYQAAVDANSEKVSNIQSDWNSTGDAAILNKSSMASASVLYDSAANNFKLPDAWVKYLQEHTMDVPVLTLSATNGVRSYEYGATVTSSFTHKETNIDNIDGTLTLYRNSSSAETNIAKSEAAAALATELNERITSSISYVLKGKDVLGGDLASGTITFSCYKPVYYGCDSAEAISGVSGLTKKASSSFGTITFSSEKGQYAYFVTVGSISSIKSSGFDVPFYKCDYTIVVTLNELNVTYNVYRTEYSLDAGENTMTIL